MKDLELALALADAADEISLARFQALDLKIETKPDRTPVTDADQSVEKKIREMISQLAPADIVKKALTIAGDLCIYTNQSHTIESLD